MMCVVNLVASSQQRTDLYDVSVTLQSAFRDSTTAMALLHGFLAPDWRLVMHAPVQLVFHPKPFDHVTPV